MDYLITSNEELQANGLTEFEAWLEMLSTSQSSVFRGYLNGDHERVEISNREIDFIQKQLVRLQQR